MRWLLATIALLCVRAELVEARGTTAAPVARPSTPSGRTAEERETPDQVARRYGVAGELLVARGDKVLLDRGYGPIAPGGGEQHQAGERWRLASITKQITAALFVGAVANHSGLSALDKPLRITAGAPASGFSQHTVRDLLTHHSGLANPDDTPKNEQGVPSFYTGNVLYDRTARLLFCASKPPRHAAPFAYNNCDYLLLHLGMSTISWPAGMTMAQPDEFGVPGFVGGKPEPRFQLANWGAAGGLMGTARAVFAFDRSLMTGKLLPPAALAELWKPEGHGSYQALGQWVFPGQLKGCSKRKRIVQRDGEIYGVQARNFILPDDDLVVIVFINRSSDDFPIGEVWQGKGFAYDLLSAAACP